MAAVKTEALRSHTNRVRNNRASPERKPSPLKAAAILQTMKANPTSIAKTQTERRSRPDNRGQIVQEVIVLMAVVGIVGVVVAGIAEAAVVVLEVAAIVVLVVVAAI